MRSFGEAGHLRETALPMQAGAVESFQRRSGPPGPSAAARSARGTRLRASSLHRIAAAAPALLRASACVAALGLAALLAPAPASGQTTLVSPTVITGFFDGTASDFTGYIAPDLGGAIGSIANASFEYGGSTYTIRWLHTRDWFVNIPEEFRIRFNRALPAALQGVEVHSGSHTFAIEDADPDGGAGRYVGRNGRHRPVRGQSRWRHGPIHDRPAGPPSSPPGHLGFPDRHYGD